MLTNPCYCFKKKLDGVCEIFTLLTPRLFYEALMWNEKVHKRMWILHSQQCRYDFLEDTILENQKESHVETSANFISCEDMCTELEIFLLINYNIIMLIEVVNSFSIPK
jgi:hypothetical protein